MNSIALPNNSLLKCRVIPVTKAKQNCSLIWCKATKRAAIVDPGGDIAVLRHAILEEGLKVEKLLVTHAHPDHAGGAADLSEILKVPIEGPHPDEKPLIEKMVEMGDLYGFDWCRPFEPSRWLADGDEIPVGRARLLALHCPGHTPGHMAYFSPEARIAFVGDIIFKGTIGYTSSPEKLLELLRSIRLKLMPLGDDVTFVPGHEALSTFGEERRNSPYVSDKKAEKFNHLLAQAQEVPPFSIL